MSKAKRKFFGTDGIRGRVGVAPITPEFVLKLGYAIGRVLKSSSGRAKVVIGKDTRISGYLLESALESGLSAAGVDIVLLGPMPTPGIAYLTKYLNADAGIVISASHNPYPDNGIKIFSKEGYKLSDEMENDIEYYCGQPMEVVSPEQLGKASRLDDAAKCYAEFCLEAVKPSTISKLKCLVDCANGATYHIAPQVFSRLSIHAECINTAPDGLNINEQCGSTHLAKLQKQVVEQGFDLGIAFDGDGDRVLFVDNHGKQVDGDQLLYILATNMPDSLSGGVVGTEMSNYGLELAMREKGIEFKRAKVGDRHVMQKLEENGWVLGGESSGHIISLNKTTTGDGIIAALQVLEALSKNKKSLAELTAGMTKLPQTMVNVPLPVKHDPVQHPKVQKAIRKALDDLKAEGRVLLRCSGTEPLVRVMVEGKDEQRIGAIAQTIASVVEEVVDEVGVN